MTRLFILTLALSTMTQTLWAKSVELSSAKLYAQQGDMAKALEFAELGAQKGNKEAELYGFLVEVYSKKSRWDDMNKAYGKISSCGDKEKRIKKALKTADRIVENSWIKVYNSGVTSQNEAIASLGAGDTTACIDNYRQAVGNFMASTTIRPMDLSGYKAAQSCLNNVTVFSEESKRCAVIEEQSAIYDQMIAAYPDSLQFKVQKLRTWSNFRFDDRVIDVAESIISESGESPEVLKFYGYAKLNKASQLEEGETKVAARMDAFKLMQRAFALNSDDADMSYDIASLYSEVGEYLKAIEQYEHTLNMPGIDDELKYECQRRLGIVSLKASESVDEPEALWEKAIKYYEMAYAYDNTDPSVKMYLGRALIRLGASKGDSEMITRGTSLTQ